MMTLYIYTQWTDEEEKYHFFFFYCCWNPISFNLYFLISLNISFIGI